MDFVNVVITGVLGGGFFAFLQFMITRHDKKRNEVEELRKEFAESKEKSQEAFDEIRKILLEMQKEDKKQKELLEAQGHELLGLAHDKLVYLTGCYVERGAITLKELATLKSLYIPYHNELGGNGDGQAGYEACSDLKVVSEQEARAMDNEAKRKKYGLI